MFLNGNLSLLKINSDSAPLTSVKEPRENTGYGAIMKADVPIESLTARERKDLKVLALFSAVYCRVHHRGEKSPLDADSLGMSGTGVEKYRYCPECRDFLDYAVTRRIRCPLDPKPTCKHCHIHCYRPGHREKVREIMRFSGKHLIRRGRLDLLWHYFF